MGIWYHRLMARFYMKWNPKGFKKHVRKLIDILEVRIAFMVMNAPPEILEETDILKAHIVITHGIYYDVVVKVSEVKKLLEVEKK